MQKRYASHVDERALPLSLIPENPKGAVLLVHGFTGYPREFEGVARALYDRGLAVEAPRLPGHGTDGHDFSTYGRREWLACAIESYRELETIYPGNVSIGGHSMGGLIATLVSSVFEPRRLMLVAPAFRFLNKSIPFAALAAPFVKMLKGTDERNEDPFRDFLYREYRKNVCVKNISELVKLSSEARRALRKVKADILIVIANEDDSVSPESESVIRKHAASKHIETLVLENSPHCAMLGPEAALLEAAAADWFAEGKYGNAK